MSKIHVLQDDLINKIAAGEVVERPASVVKELIENAIDAGSTRIEIEIKAGGVDYIRITDNGSGMAEDDLALAFTRHATSKLSAESDLWVLHSLGFRGEALPSIASVARVEMISNTGDTGYGITIEGGVLSSVRPVPAPKGSSITVKDLFFNTPARRKFLKSVITEGNQILDAVTRMALSHPEISFSFSNENRRVFITTGDGSLYNAALAVFGNDFAERFLVFEDNTGDIQIKGLIGNINFTRKNRRGQYFFVNQRSVRNSILSTALEEGFRGFLVSGERPVGVVFLEIPTNDVDVNVHPQKAEVRFKDEQAVFATIKRTVRARLYSETGAVTEVRQEPVGERTPSIASSPTFEPRPAYESRPVYDSRPSHNYSVRERASYQYEPILQQQSRPSPVEPVLPGKLSFEETISEPVLETIKVYGQWKDSYIICEIEDRLEIIDQHAAHERILYNRLKGHQDRFIGQDLAIPVMLESSPQVIQRIENNQAIIKSLGFVTEPFGERSLVIREVPAMTAGSEVETLLEIIDYLEDERDPQQVLDEGLKIIACKGAIKAGQHLDIREMKDLLQQWMQAEDHHACPHGRPTRVSFTIKELEKQLKR
ncbi:MAG: DNA mismatch repair endonuclease MutL [Acidobacteriota bacterium]